MDTVKVGIREFRDNLATYLDSERPIAVTRHGATVGIYLPTRPKATDKDWAELREVNAKMQKALAQVGIGEDDVVADFKRLRKASPR